MTICEHLKSRPTAQLTFIGYLPEFIAKLISRRGLAVGYWRGQFRRHKDCELASGLFEVALELFNWSYDQLLVRLGEFPAHGNEVLRAEGLAQVRQGSQEAVRRLEKHGQTTNSKGLSEPLKPGF
jgi:hypothetical protein